MRSVEKTSNSISFIDKYRKKSCKKGKIILKFANIVVDISHEKLDKTFQYVIPKELEDCTSVGTQVEIPFGKGNRLITGYIIEITEKPEYDILKMKEISGVKKGSLKIESQLILLARFIKEEYGCTMNKALKTVIPVKKSVKGIEKRYVELAIDPLSAKTEIEKYAKRKNTQARAQLLEKLLVSSRLAIAELTTKFEISQSVIHAMEKQGLVRITSDSIYRNPVKDLEKENRNIELNAEQRIVSEAIKQDIIEQKYNTHLIYGITGCGKTEVYMDVIEKVLELGKDVIVLIPEIALTYQTIHRFYSKFGNQVSIINSRLSAGERYDQFERAKNGEIHVMVGPRSALFTPFRNLGAIIIDEEHENAYKSEQVPKYHAREVAIYRAKFTNAVVVLGSATPSVNSYYQALNGKFILHKITKRANESKLPEVEVIDLREELEYGNRDIFSRRLKELIHEHLTNKEQIMLFINRRGYSSFISCRSCGKAIKCPHCDVTLTLHKKYGKADRLECHYCGYSIEMPRVCPKCSSKYIGRFGVGTEQVEEKIRELYPGARTLRMDMDTTREKGKLDQILDSFSKGEADILIGTQMIVKGHDFPKVTLVGIIAADLSFFSSDYMASERTFQLLTQAAGRAGRGSIPGKVIIQTYNPDEMCIEAAKNQDFEGFYEKEISYRSLMAYPPIYQMVAILISDKNEEFANKTMEDITKRIINSKIEELMIIGPTKASVSKINDIYRYVVYLKHPDKEMLIKIKNATMRYLEMVPAYQKLSVQFDFNPMNVY